MMTRAAVPPMSTTPTVILATRLCDTLCHLDVSSGRAKGLAETDFGLLWLIGALGVAAARQAFLPGGETRVPRKGGYLPPPLNRWAEFERLSTDLRSSEFVVWRPRRRGARPGGAFGSAGVQEGYRGECDGCDTHDDEHDDGDHAATTGTDELPTVAVGEVRRGRRLRRPLCRSSCSRRRVYGRAAGGLFVHGVLCFPFAGGGLPLNRARDALLG